MLIHQEVFEGSLYSTFCIRCWEFNEKEKLARSWSLKSNECVCMVAGRSEVLQRVPGDAALYMVAYFVWGFDVCVCLFLKIGN